MKTDDPHPDAVILGAGASGLLAAIRAAERGRRVLLLEKKARPGAKILLSGGGRCNLTHDTDARGIVAAFGPPGRFLHAALAALGPRDVVDLVAAEGVRTVVDPGGNVFPASQRATDVLDALLRRLRRAGVEIACGEPVKDLARDTGGGFRVVSARRTLCAPRVLIATGGMSYPGCGTTGDGYRWAAALGHTVIPPRPALVPVAANDPWARALQGIVVNDARVRVVGAPGVAPAKAKAPAGCRGAVLFTHLGLSGPAVMDASRALGGRRAPAAPALEIDLLPDVPRAALESLLRGAAAESGRRLAAGLLPDAIPRRLRDALCGLAGVPADRRASQLSREERARLVDAVKALRVPIRCTLGFAKAEVTAGGVALDEVDPRTMESRVVPGLYLAGEALDLDGPIGGYNLQAAFSTGWLAGNNA
jgi:predicted Rossmann fold flavoprotein